MQPNIQFFNDTINDIPERATTLCPHPLRFGDSSQVPINRDWIVRLTFRSSLRSFSYVASLLG